TGCTRCRSQLRTWPASRRLFLASPLGSTSAAPIPTASLANVSRNRWGWPFVMPASLNRGRSDRCQSFAADHDWPEPDQNSRAVLTKRLSIVGTMGVEGSLVTENRELAGSVDTLKQRKALKLAKLGR